MGLTHPSDKLFFPRLSLITLHFFWGRGGTFSIDSCFESWFYLKCNSFYTKWLKKSIFYFKKGWRSNGVNRRYHGVGCKYTWDQAMAHSSTKSLHPWETKGWTIKPCLHKPHKWSFAIARVCSCSGFFFVKVDGIRSPAAGFRIGCISLANSIWLNVKTFTAQMI